MTPPLSYLQNTFVGGMNQQTDASRLKANEYPLLINGRTRYDTIDPIKVPIDSTPPGVTLVQGCYAAGSFLIVFADGKAFYRDYTIDNTAFTQIVGFQMSSTVPQLFACPVPASTIGGIRKLNSSLNTINGPILLTGSSAPSPQALVVQDGVNQPMIIFPNGTTRVTGSYNIWTQAFREYVPIGKQMLYQGSILYIVSPDGLQIYRSVSGRPLDFVVIVDKDANKLPAELDGGAAAISHKVDYSPITAIATLNAPEGDFYVSTARTSYAVRPQFNITPFGEPSFANIFMFSTGAVNNFSFCDILGDSAVIDYSGIRSFNAVQQYRIEGKNSPFSAKISKLIAGQKQSFPAAYSFDNYGLFSVATVFGYGILVYSTLTQEWASLDIMPELANQLISMFAEVKTSTTRRLFCATGSKVWELYPDSGENENIGYYTPEFNSGDPNINQKGVFAKVVFLDVLTPGTVTATLVEDGKVGVKLRFPISGVLVDSSKYPIPPVLLRDTDKVRSASFSLLDSSRSCWKFGLYLQWNFSAKISAVKVISNREPMNVSIEEKLFISGSNVLSITTLSPQGFSAGAFLDIFGGGFSGITALSVNWIEILTFTIMSDGWIRAVLPPTWIAGSPPIIVDVTGHDVRFVYGIVDDHTTVIDNVIKGINLYVPPSVVDDTKPPVDVVNDIRDWFHEQGVLDTPPTIIDVPVPVVVPPAPAPCPTIIQLSTGIALGDYFVVNVTDQYGQPSLFFLGATFRKNSDGSYTYLSPMISMQGGNDNSVFVTEYEKIGKTMIGLQTFTIAGMSFCIFFPNNEVVPPPVVVNPPIVPPVIPPVDGPCDTCPPGVSLQITGYPTFDSPSGDHDVLFGVVTKTAGLCEWTWTDPEYSILIQRIAGVWSITFIGTRSTDAFNAVFTGRAGEDCPVGIYANAAGTAFVT